MRRPPFRRLYAEPLEPRSLLAANVWHNAANPFDVNADEQVSPLDALVVIDDLHANGSRELLGEGEPATLVAPFIDVNGDGVASALDALIVIGQLLAQGEPGGPLITTADVTQLLDRAAAASASDNAIIAVVDRNGRILGVRAESTVITDYGVGTIGERTTDFVFAVDGAVAKARTAAFFANNQGPLTSRTIRFISQSTVTQREVESNPNITSLASTLRGPGFVAPIGIGGHFPPDIAHTPPVDLFAIEHTNRDSLLHPGADSIKGTPDDIVLATRFDADPAFIPAGKTLFAPESYGYQSGRLITAQSRGIATLPGGIPLYKDGTLVGGIGVFFPGPDGYATFEQGFVPGIGQSTYDRTNAPRVLEAEWIAFAAAGGSSGAAASVGALNSIAPVAGYDLPFGRIDLVGITLEIYGPHPTASRPITGVQTLLQVGGSVGRGAPASGANQMVTPVSLVQAGLDVPEGWLVMPHASGSLSLAEVERIIQQGIDEANLDRAAIRLQANGKPGARTKMVLAVADLNGAVLGLYRMPDATVFSLDVAVAKARNTAYYADPTALVASDRVDDDGDGAPDANVPAGVGFTNRTFRFLAEPRFPSGVDGSRPGAFSILLDPGIDPATAENLGPVLPASVYASAATSVLGFDAFNPGRNFRDPDDIAHQNGVVFFPGSAPLYDASVLAGGLGISGDGVDQDDVVTFSATVGFATPANLRADQYFVRGVRLPYQKFNRNPRG